MGALAMEINDAGLVVAAEDEVLAVEPGYAISEGGKITTGAAAQAEARVKAHQVSNRYWASLSLEPGSGGLGAMSAAELAYAHLEALWRRFGDGVTEVVLVVPGGYTREQLGLLLGLAEECGMPVAALIDAAVAASSRPYPARQIVHADAGLHRAWVTSVKQAEEAIAEREHALDATGLVTANDLLARWIAELFVLATRFDPFHDARSEQALYDRLPQWLEALRSAEEAALDLDHEGEIFTVSVRREQLQGVVAGFNRALVQLIAQAREPSKSLVVQLSDRLAELPGLAAQLARLDDARIVRLPRGHAARAALRRFDAISGSGVRLLKHLPWREPVEEDTADGDSFAAAQADPGRLDESAPTHVVYRGVAYSVGPGGLAVGRVERDGRRTLVVDGEHGGLSRLHCELVLRDGQLRVKDLSRYGTFVNEKRIAGETVLHPADVIRIGSPGAELHVIRVSG